MNKNNISLITLTDNAAFHIKKMIQNYKQGVLGIRILVKSKGCSGLSYDIEYVFKKRVLDEEIFIKDVTLFIDPKAIMFIIGSEMDYKENILGSGFFFTNPNEKSRCGCGESFCV